MIELLDSLLAIPPSTLAVDPEQWPVYIGLFATSFVKFFVAAIIAMADSTLNFLEYAATVGGGALLSVPIYTFFGDQIRRFFVRFWPSKPKTEAQIQKQQARQTRNQRFWQRFGLTGVAALAPFISPMISVGIAVSFNEKPWRIIAYVGSSIVIWTILFFLLRNQLLILADSLNLLT